MNRDRTGEEHTKYKIQTPEKTNKISLIEKLYCSASSVRSSGHVTCPIYSRFPGIRTWTSGGAIILPTPIYPLVFKIHKQNAFTLSQHPQSLNLLHNQYNYIML